MYVKSVDHQKGKYEDRMDLILPPTLFTTLKNKNKIQRAVLHNGGRGTQKYSQHREWRFEINALQIGLSEKQLWLLNNC